MQYLIATAICFSLFVNVCLAGENLKLKDENDRVNYSVGYQIGGDFKKQGVALNPEAIVKGIQDALTGTTQLMSQQEMRTTLVELKKRIIAAQKEQANKAAQKNLITGKAFLADNKQKEGVKVLPSGLQYKIIQKGSGTRPQATDTVTVRYRGTLIDGSEFDSSFKRGKPATFQVNRVIKGWSEALQMMKEGAKWQLFIPADLAYGKRGAGALIGPNSTLIFDVELVSVHSGAQ